LRGDGLRRDGTEDATAEAGGVTTQNLKHLDLLLVAPWNLDLTPSDALPISVPARVHVANPVSFIAQKLLIHGLRKPDKRSQDLLYIHDTLELFGARLPQLNQLWHAKVGPSLLPADRSAVPRLGRELFAALNDTIREASRKTSADRRLPPEEMRLRAEVGLGELFRTESDQQNTDR
jgi:Nucleotidyltransferase